ncbi:WD40 repeat domain-containing protein [Sinosporangium siamense]|uniref:Novel STAND NTPase 1 domain-containing protein n=1 Tax=Sinosporangium siamense TaxID=1367973 RepID=A0A919RS96_9ACTN|nr:WD40 repeat domain-containing protein [Sinosporangium siamense]GII97344.1 hypothetical protein Ssi02_75750 [Sinosporangium siamense]
MPRRNLTLTLTVMLFVVLQVLQIAGGYLTNQQGGAPPILRELQASPLPPVVILLTLGLLLTVLTARAGTAPPIGNPRWNSRRSPYPGLDAFTADDAGVFFGRDAEIGRLLQRLHPVSTADPRRVVVVAGPSGVGKSSLVHAGLLPNLANRRTRWIVGTLHPGDDPVRELTHNLTSLLAAAHRPVRGRRRHMLLVIDRAEELFTLAGEAVRGEFLTVLDSLVRTHPQLWVVVVTRSEFLTGFQESSHAHLFQEPLTLGPLGREQLVEVIVRPAERAGLTFDPPHLPGTIADDTGGGPSLPLLAFTLEQLFARARGGPITAKDYADLGGVPGVIARQADRIVRELNGSPAADSVVRTLLRLVAVHNDVPARRRVPLDGLDDDERVVVEAFVTGRLLTRGGGEKDASPYAEIAHEAFLAVWPPLRQTVAAHHESLRLRSLLEQWATEWIGSGEKQSYLLGSERLTLAHVWLDHHPRLAADAPRIVRLVDCSRRAAQAAGERAAADIARRSLLTLEESPAEALAIAVTAHEEHGPEPLVRLAVSAALNASRCRRILGAHRTLLRGVAWLPGGRRLISMSHDGATRVWDTTTGTEVAAYTCVGAKFWGCDLSPDGRLLVAGAEDGVAGVWAVEDGRKVRDLRGHSEWVRSAVWSPDGGRVVTSSDDQTARIWDVELGEEVNVLQGHRGRVWGACFSPDGDRIASVSHDRTVRIWDATTGQPLHEMPGHEDGVVGVAWSPDGTTVASCSDDATVRLWDPQAGDLVRVLRGHKGWVWGVCWSPDSRLVASSGQDRTTRVWQARSGAQRHVLLDHQEGGVTAAAWSPDGTRLATAGGVSPKLWDEGGGPEQRVLREHEGWVTGVSWNPGGDLLSTISLDRKLRIWDHSAWWNDHGVATVRTHKDGILAHEWSPDGTRVATGSQDGTAAVWSAGTAGHLTLAGHSRWVSDVSWSPDGTRLATASTDHTARIWSAGDGTPLAELRGHTQWLSDVTWSPAGTLLATASHDTTARVWNTVTGEQVHTVHGMRPLGDWEVTQHRVAWSSCGGTLAVVLADGGVVLWHAATRGEKRLYAGHTGTVTALCWSPDGRWLATAADDGAVLLTDVAGRAPAVRLDHAGEAVEKVAWSPDGLKVATATGDGAVRVWSSREGRETLTAGRHTRSVTALAWSPDGTRLATAACDGTARVWNATMETADVVALAKSRMLFPLPGRYCEASG